MVVWRLKSKRKPSGGLKGRHRKKRSSDKGRVFLKPSVSENEGKIKDRVRGGRIKIRMLRVSYANVFDREKNECKKVKIIEVVENPSNPHYTRRNIVTKGCVIKTELGNARVTSRVCQEGFVNAVLLKKEE